MKYFVQANKYPYLFITPAVVVTVMLAGYGWLMAVKESFADDDRLFAYYRELIRIPAIIDSLKISLFVAFISTILSLVIGLCITRCFYKWFSSDYWKYIIWFPMLIPHFIAGYIVYSLLSQSGFFSSIAYQIGWIEQRNQFPIIIQDPFYIGVMLSYLWKEIPFVVLMLLPAYQQLDVRYEEAAQTLGANQWEAFKTVELPWIGPVLLEIGVIIFVFVLSAFEIPNLLGVTYPKLLPVLAYDWFFEDNWEKRPLVQALMVSLTVFSVIICLVLFGVTQKLKTRLMRGNS